MEESPTQKAAAASAAQDSFACLGLKPNVLFFEGEAASSEVETTAEKRVWMKKRGGEGLHFVKFFFFSSPFNVCPACVYL